MLEYTLFVRVQFVVVTHSLYSFFYSPPPLQCAKGANVKPIVAKDDFTDVEAWMRNEHKTTFSNIFHESMDDLKRKIRRHSEGRYGVQPMKSPIGSFDSSGREDVLMHAFFT